MIQRSLRSGPPIYYTPCGSRSYRGENRQTQGQHVFRGELEHILYAALARLPDRYRLAIDLRHRQALPFDEVARRLVISSPAARQLWARAIQRLQKELRAEHLQAE